MGVSGGLTLFKSAESFTAPVFTTRNVHEREGTVTRHYAEVQPTTTSDVTHLSYYPGPGDHMRPGTMQMIDGKAYTHYWRISRQISDLMRRGEEEHLADVKRAYEITYKLIADTINAMVGKRYGPGATPREADLLAEAELATKLPAALGTNPANWAKVLDRLLTQTKNRDKEGWHSISINPPITEGSKFVDVVDVASTTRIGRVSSDQVVNY